MLISFKYFIGGDTNELNYCGIHPVNTADYITT